MKNKRTNFFRQNFQLIKSLLMLACLFYLSLALADHSKAFAMDKGKSLYKQAYKMKTPVVVYEDLIRLKDLFTPTPPRGKTAVLRAPKLGTRGYISKTHLIEIAKKYQLNWHPGPQLKQIQVSRPALVLSKKYIHERIKKEALDMHPLPPGQSYDLTIDSPAEIKGPGTFQKTQILVDFPTFPKGFNGRFSARLKTRAGGALYELGQVRGKIAPMVDVVTPVANLQKNHILTQNDLKITKLRRSQVRTAYYTSFEDVIGMKANGQLQKDRPLTNKDLSPLYLVQKDRLVTISYHLPGLKLIMEGRALDDGALGAIIKVENPKSKRLLEAKVIDHDLVEIKSPHQSRQGHNPLLTGAIKNHKNKRK